MNSNFSLEQKVAVEGAENISLTLELAGMGNRMLAFLLDSLIIGLLLFAIIIVFSFLGLLSGNETLAYVILAVLILALFLIPWGYFIIFELIWHGQTPGKKVLRIKVVREDGRPVNLAASFLRNIMRIVDMLPSGYAVGLISIFFHAREKRVGDIVGGTIVVKEPRAAFPVSPAGMPPPAASPRVDTPALAREARHLTTAEIELIGDFLERRHTLEYETRFRLGRILAVKLARRLGLEPPADAENFLEYLGSLVFPGR